MTDKIIIGIIPSSDAQTAIDNLVEAEFEESALSLIMKNNKRARTIIDDQGPLKGTTFSNAEQKLQQLGTANKPQDFIKSLNDGKALIAVSAPGDSVEAAKEILQDYKAEFITILSA